VQAPDLGSGQIVWQFQLQSAIWAQAKAVDWLRSRWDAFIRSGGRSLIDGHGENPSTLVSAIALTAFIVDVHATDCVAHKQV
jgi:hypothetical protein